MYFFSPLCDVFLFVKGELRWWESRNSIAVNSNTPPSHSTLWHWCGTKVSRVTSQTFTTGHKGIALLGSRNTGVLCCFVRRWSTHRENKPHLAHEEKFWDSNKCWQKKKELFSVFLKSRQLLGFGEGCWYQVCWTLSMWHPLSLPKNCTEKLTSNCLSGHKPSPLTPSLWRK